MAPPKMDEILKQLEVGVADLFSTQHYKNYLTYMAKFHKYSINNVLWLFLQNPAVSNVAGFSTWKKLGRYVRKGEKSLWVIAPIPYKQTVEKEVVNSATQKPTTETVEIIKNSFRAAPVFDVSQTEGKPLPRLAYELESNVENYNTMLAAIQQICPVPISFETLRDENGYYSLTHKKVVIRSGMSQAQTIKTAIHETAHAILHDIPTTKEKDRATIEVEAESIAYVVCQHFGIDSSDYSFGYLASWSGDKEVPQLKASLETIRGTASQCIVFLNQQLEPVQELSQEDLHNELQSLYCNVMAAALNPHAGTACHAITTKQLQTLSAQLLPTDALRGFVLAAAGSPDFSTLHSRMQRLEKAMNQPAPKRFTVAQTPAKQPVKQRDIPQPQR